MREKSLQRTDQAGPGLEIIVGYLQLHGVQTGLRWSPDQQLLIKL